LNGTETQFLHALNQEADESDEGADRAFEKVPDEVFAMNPLLTCNEAGRRHARQ
jgi:hypothetical protein